MNLELLGLLQSVQQMRLEVLLVEHIIQLLADLL